MRQELAACPDHRACRLSGAFYCRETHVATEDNEDIEPGGVSPLLWHALDGEGVTAAEGFSAASVACGLKESEAHDLAVVFSDREAAAAGVFTSNQVKAAPVLLSQARVASGRAQAVVINSGNANACTGEQGRLDAEEMAALAAEKLGVDADLVLVASTGHIGHPLPMDALRSGIPAACAALSPSGGPQAARAIITTDTRPKEMALEMELAGARVRLGGMAKGAGMICPAMATMICVITTDAGIEARNLDLALRWAVDRSFNCITVDGDMSTNDTVLVLANGASGAQVLKEEDRRKFQRALDFITARLARAIVADGEGATKTIQVHVSGTKEYEQARRVAMAIANSPLVKTALYGGDPNWGRIMGAAGAAGVEFDPGAADLSLAGIPVVGAGAPLPFDEKGAAQAVSEREITIHLDLHAGPQSATVYTCDLSEEYVRINAHYTT
ncbi:MAG: bifunctional glutamate N-acetyltransferase/amino-acid acetyltransferase ArgJ [Armatimonadota bacterium]|nr:MAG: bifunctional glutamate N-acetyltransferase/amino-acid acetyltransferase ArgJ [Armatimonadota bacterium]